MDDIAFIPYYYETGSHRVQVASVFAWAYGHKKIKESKPPENSRFAFRNRALSLRRKTSTAKHAVCVLALVSG